jgi:hypothetical protein
MKSQSNRRNDRRKPTRRDLLIVIGRLQSKIGRALGVASNDRNQNQQAILNGVLQEAHDLCIDARGQDDPIDAPTGPWADDGIEKEYS